MDSPFGAVEGGPLFRLTAVLRRLGGVCTRSTEAAGTGNRGRLTRGSSALWLRRRDKLRRKVGHLALHLCGACAGCLEGWRPFGPSAVEVTAGPAGAAPAAALQDDKLTRFFDVDIVNDLIAKEWPHISAWFGRKMKLVVEPLLKRNISDFVEFSLCNLGTKALRLDDVSSAEYLHARTGEEKRMPSIMYVGELNYCGDGEIHVEVKAGGTVAKVRLNKLVVRGQLVIELVRLIDIPPWFSGMRFYFPNAPEVDIGVQTEVFVLDAIYNTATMIQTRVVQQVKNVIGSYAVLPNTYAIDLCKGLDPFQLRHPQPQGVVRMHIQELATVATSSSTADLPGNTPSTVHASAASAPDESTEASGAVAELAPTGMASGVSRRTWAEWLLRRGRAKRECRGSSSPCHLDVTIGNSTLRCKVGEVHDFIVSDLRHQTVRIATRDHSGTVSDETEVNVLDLLANQRTDDDGAIRPSEYRVATFPDVVEGDLNVRAQWRPCAIGASTISRALELGPLDSGWALGEPLTCTWLLLVDLYHATGLPGAEIGTQHWVSVGVRRRGADEPPLVQQDSPCAEARAPVQQALEILRNIGEFRGGFPVEAEDALRSVSPEVWRESLGCSGAASASSSSPGPRSDPQAGPVDVVWEHPFCLRMDSRESLLQSIKALEILVVVKRPERRKVRDTVSKRPAERILGQEKWNLALLVSRDDYSEDVCLRFPVGAGASKTTASLRMRVHVRPLEMAPDMCRQAWRKNLRDGWRLVGDVARAAAKRSMRWARPETDMEAKQDAAATADGGAAAGDVAAMEYPSTVEQQPSGSDGRGSQPVSINGGLRRCTGPMSSAPELCRLDPLASASGGPAVAGSPSTASAATRSTGQGRSRTQSPSEVARGWAQPLLQGLPLSNVQLSEAVRRDLDLAMDMMRAASFQDVEESDSPLQRRPGEGRDLPPPASSDPPVGV